MPHKTDELPSEAPFTRLVDSAGSIKAALGQDANGDPFMSKLESDGDYNAAFGGFILKPNAMSVLGQQFEIAGLTSGTPQYLAINNGIVYGVDPPDLGWRDQSFDFNNYDLGEGIGQGADTHLVDTATNFAQDVAANERFDIEASIWIDSIQDAGSAGLGGVVEIGFGVDGALPSTWFSFTINQFHNGYINFNSSVTTHGGYTTANAVSIWVRRFSGDSQGPDSFHPYADGTQAGGHQLTLSGRPGAGAVVAGVNSLLRKASMVFEDNVTATAIAGISTDWSNRVKVEAFNDAPSNRISANGITVDLANNRFVITEDGLYDIYGNLSISNGSNDTISYAVYVNGVTRLTPKSTRKYGTGGDVGNSGIIVPSVNLVQNDIIEVYTQNETAIDNILFEDGSISISGVGT